MKLNSKEQAWVEKRINYSLGNINSMLIYLKRKGIAEIQYIDIAKDSLTTKKLANGVSLYNYKTCSKVSINQVVNIALESGWKPNNKMAKSTSTHNKSFKSNERTMTSYLMSKTTDQLVKDKKYHKFVQDCIAEHGYAWQYKFTTDSFLSKRESLLYKKRKK